MHIFFKVACFELLYAALIVATSEPLTRARAFIYELNVTAPRFRLPQASRAETARNPPLHHHKNEEKLCTECDGLDAFDAIDLMIGGAILVIS